MRYWRPVVVGILALILTPLLPAGPSLGHPGDGGGALDDAHRLQAEQYDVAESNCDPDRDDEHIQPSDRAGARGVFMGLSGCSITLNSVHFPVGARPSQFRVERSAQSGREMEVQVYVDELLKGVGRFRQHSTGATTYETFAFTGTAAIAAGTHNVRIEYRVTDGEDWRNIWIDWVSFLLDCVNDAPVPTPTADGLGGGMVGWPGHAYDLSAGALTDTEGDPFTVTWEWSDGVVQDGVATVRTFDVTATAPVVRTATIRVVEDVSARCPEVQVWERTYGPFPFTVVPDPVVGHETAAAGLSCNGGLFVPSWLGDDVVLGTCPMRLALDLRGTDPGLVGAASFDLDGVTTAPTRTAPAALDLDATSLAAGTHEVRACTTMMDDKYGRRFCSAAYTFRSIPCDNRYGRFDRVTSDGLSGVMAGWKDRSYTFTTAGLVDADGDPLRVRYEWPDGTTGTGATVSRSFPLGTHAYHVVLEEDLTGRCAAAGVVPTIYGQGALTPPEPLVFHSIGDWTPTFENPLPGTSCLYTVRVPNGLSQADMMAGTCRVKANVVPGAPGVVPVGTLYLDATQTIGTRSGAAFWAWYESLEHSTGRHWIEVCFVAEEDKYGRRFCTPIHPFWNVGRP